MRQTATATETEARAVQRRALAAKAAEMATLRMLEAKAVGRLAAKEILRQVTRGPRRRT